MCTYIYIYIYIDIHIKEPGGAAHGRERHGGADLREVH